MSLNLQVDLSVDVVVFVLFWAAWLALLLGYSVSLKPVHIVRIRTLVVEVLFDELLSRSDALLHLIVEGVE